jgi:hypothetical protein
MKACVRIPLACCRVILKASVRRFLLIFKLTFTIITCLQVKVPIASYRHWFTDSVHNIDDGYYKPTFRLRIQMAV